MSLWKSTPKIDAHIHILPDAVIAANQGVDDPFISAGGIEAYVRLMDQYNILKAVVMPFNDPFLMSMEFTVSAVHRNLSDFQTQYGDRFLPFADVDPRNTPEETIGELRRILPSGAFAGIKLHPTNADLPLDGDTCDAIFTFAEGAGIPVEVHSYPRENDPGDICAPGRLRQVLARHPNLRVSVAHLGGFQYDALFGLNIYVNFSCVLPELVNRLGIRGANQVLRKFGTDRLIFGTDYPDSRNLSFDNIYPEYFSILDQMDFSPEEVSAICRGNILRFLGKD